jgi:hypothetical protein
MLPENDSALKAVGYLFLDREYKAALQLACSVRQKASELGDKQALRIATIAVSAIEEKIRQITGLEPQIIGSIDAFESVTVYTS